MSRATRRAALLLSALAAIVVAAWSARAAACAVTWDGGGGTTSWHTAANWDTDAVPGTGAHVCIPDVPGTPTIAITSTTTVASLTSAERVSVAASVTLSGPDASAVSALAIESGIVAGASSLTVTGAMTWRSGEVWSTLTIAPGATLDLVGTSGTTGRILRYTSARLVNQGTLRMIAPIQYGLHLVQGRLENPGTVEMVGAVAISRYGDAAETVRNTGTIRRTGSGLAEVAVLDNDGTVDVDAGSLRVGASPDAADTGSYLNDGTLEFAGSRTLAASSQITGSGSVAVTAGTVTFGIAYAQPTSIVAGNAVFNAAPAFTDLSVTGGGAASFGVPASLTNVTLDNANPGPRANIGGSGTLTVTGAMTWRSGEVWSALTIAPGATLDLTGASGTTGRILRNTSARLVNQGTLRMIAPIQYGGLHLVQGRLENSGVVEMDGAVAISRLGHAGENVHNIGTIRKTGAGLAEVAVLDNDGTVDVDAGTLRIGASVDAADTGSYVNDGTLEFAGSRTLASSSQLTGSGSVAVTAGTVTFGIPYAQPTSIVAGIAVFNAPLALPSLSLSGSGIVQGTGTITPAVMTWTGGRVAARVVIPAGGTLAMSGSTKTLDTTTLRNAGTATWSGGIISTQGAPVLENDGTFEFSSTQPILRGTGSPMRIVNTGTMRRTGTGTTAISAILDNRGTLEVAGGTVDLQDQMANYDAATKTLGGGSFVVAGILQLPTIDVVTNAASVLLDGASSSFREITGGNKDAFRNLTSNTGAFMLRNGRSFTRSGALTNRGSISVDSGSTLTLGGTFEQTDGFTSLDSAASRLVAPRVEIGSGTIEGVGIVDAPVTEVGGRTAPGYPPDFSPGFSAGLLTFTGQLVQSSSSETRIQIGGVQLGAGFDRIDVAGTVNLGGTLEVETEAYRPRAGDTFRILDADVQRNGSFSVVQGAPPAPGLRYDVLYEPQGVVLEVVASSPNDPDGDGLDNADEVVAGSDASDRDSDDDALSDGQEVHEHGTDPVDEDTDDGGVGDGAEVRAGTDPLDPADEAPLPPLQYLALGDAIAAGQGLEGEDACGRSPGAYATEVAALLGADYEVASRNLACAGALAAGTRTDDLPAQVERARALRTGAPGVATITIGWHDLDLATVDRQRFHLCTQDDSDAEAGPFARYADDAADRIEAGVRSAVRSLLADPAMTVVLTELYQPLNAYPRYLDELAFAGGSSGRPCDPDHPNTDLPHRAVQRAEHLADVVNDRFLGIVRALPLHERGRVRIAPIQRRMLGHEGGAHASGFCGAAEPSPADTWVQSPIDGAAARAGDCLYPNARGASAIAAAVIESIPDRRLPVDRLPPGTEIAFTSDQTVRARSLGDTISGRAIDRGMGVVGVTVTFVSGATGERTDVVPLLRCTANRRSCRFTVAIPDALLPGRYTVLARASDVPGNAEPGGASIDIVVAP